jgi:hypothetical protein
MCAGVFVAWQAVHPIEAPLPPDTLAALKRISNLQDLGKDSTLPDFICASTLDLSIVSFIVSEHQQSANTADTIKSQQHFLPNIAETINASLADLSSFSHLRAQDAVVYLDKDSIPFLENKETKEDEKIKPRPLSPQQVSTLGWHLYSQLPPPTSAPGNLRALILVTPPDTRPFVVETAFLDMYSNSSYKISENVLLVLVPANLAADQNEAASNGGGKDYNEEAADEILNWLSAYSTFSNVVDGAAKSNSIASQCMQKAASEISKFVKSLNLASETGIKITSDIAGAAGAASSSYTLAEQSYNIKHSRRAWQQARELATHSDLGATPQLPSEHVLALLLPIGLPIFLAIVQAIAREVKEAKKGDEETEKEKEA